MRMTCLAGGRIDLDVGDVGREAALGAGVLSCVAAPIGPPVSDRLGGDLLQRQRLELAGVVAGRTGVAVVPGDGFLVDLPDLGGALHSCLITFSADCVTTIAEAKVTRLPPVRLEKPTLWCRRSAR